MPAGLVYCTVARVVDGDTIEVRGCADAGTVRLLLIDTPEVFFGTECFGRESSDYTKNALPVGSEITLERDVSDTDSFGRYLRYVWTGGKLFNEQIVRDGYAALAIYPPGIKYVHRIALAETEAHSFSRGLWPICGGVDRPTSPTPTPPSTPVPPVLPPGRCYPSYPTICIPASPPDLDCPQIPHRRFTVLPPDPHRFDGDKDGIGCES